MTLKVLVAYSRATIYTQVHRDYIVALKQFSDNDVSFVSVTHDVVLDFALDAFDVVFHSFDALINVEGLLSDDYRVKLRGFRGLKMVALQDEYIRPAAIRAAIKELGFQVVLTIVPQRFLEQVYPKSEFPNVTFVTVLTGYASNHTEGPRYPKVPLGSRPIVIGYRGRDIGPRYGRLGFLKFEIGRRMKEICERQGIPHDISNHETSRLYGDDWFRFIGQCRVMLGTESGSNIFDWDDSISTRYARLCEERGGLVSYEEFLPIVAPFEEQIEMGSISPRVFEAAMLHTPLLMFRGYYSGILEPDIHYLALETDFSNIDEILTRVMDVRGLKAVADRAYADLIASGSYGYRTFARMVFDLAAAHLPLGVRTATAATIPNGGADYDAAPFLREMPTPLPLGSEIFDVQHNLSLAHLYFSEANRVERILTEYEEATLRDEKALGAGADEYRRLIEENREFRAQFTTPGSLSMLEAHIPFADLHTIDPAHVESIVKEQATRIRLLTDQLEFSKTRYDVQRSLSLANIYFSEANRVERVLTEYEEATLQDEGVLGAGADDYRRFIEENRESRAQFTTPGFVSTLEAQIPFTDLHTIDPARVESIVKEQTARIRRLNDQLEFTKAHNLQLKSRHSRSSADAEDIGALRRIFGKTKKK